MHKSPDLADFWLDFKSLSSGSLSSSSVPWPDKIETLLGVSLALFCSALSSIYRILCFDFSLNPLRVISRAEQTQLELIKSWTICKFLNDFDKLFFAKWLFLYKLTSFFYNCSAFGSNQLCAIFSRETKYESIERKFKTQNPNLYHQNCYLLILTSHQLNFHWIAKLVWKVIWELFSAFHTVFDPILTQP